MREGCVMRTAKTVSLIIVSLMALGLMTAPAWAQAHYASGYTVLRTGGCTISSAGNICAHGPFAMPAAARLADYTVLWFILNCTSSADFDIDVRVNTAVVRSFDSLGGVQSWRVGGARGGHAGGRRQYRRVRGLWGGQRELHDF
jgi:hypothetical protein